MALDRLIFFKGSSISFKICKPNVVGELGTLAAIPPRHNRLPSTIRE
jgi:hypothetical protein